MQAAVILSNADETSFKDYRDCVIQRVGSVDLVGDNGKIIEAARKACSDDRLAAGMELAADDAENAVRSKKLKVDADARMSVMESKLTADALCVLDVRRAKAQ